MLYAYNVAKQNVPLKLHRRILSRYILDSTFSVVDTEPQSLDLFKTIHYHFFDGERTSYV